MSVELDVVELGFILEATRVRIEPDMFGYRTDIEPDRTDMVRYRTDMVRYRTDMVLVWSLYAPPLAFWG